MPATCVARVLIYTVGLRPELLAMVMHAVKGQRCAWLWSQAEAKGLMEDDSQRKERRRVDKFITLQVQQISATQQQVGSRYSPRAAHPAKPYGSCAADEIWLIMQQVHLLCVHA